MVLDKRAAEARREYLQNWRKRNPEKVKRYNQEYWERRVRKEENENAEATPATE